MKYPSIFYLLFFSLFVSVSCAPESEPEPTPLAALTMRELPSATPTSTPTETPTPTNTLASTETPAPTNTSTLTPTIPPTETPIPTETPECDGAQPTRLTIDGRAQIVNYQINIRSGPSTNNSIVNRLGIGRLVTILDGPSCDAGQLWYLIKSDAFMNDAGEQVIVEGWAVEESGDVYFLEPVN